MGDKHMITGILKSRLELIMAAASWNLEEQGISCCFNIYSVYKRRASLHYRFKVTLTTNNRLHDKWRQYILAGVLPQKTHFEHVFFSFRVLCQVSCELVPPKDSRPTEGIMFFNLELSPMASPAFEPNRFTLIYTQSCKSILFLSVSVFYMYILMPVSFSVCVL